MEILTSYQGELINLFKNIAFFLCLLLVVGLVFYNWLYLSKIVKSNDQLGLRPPRHIHNIVKTCIFVPFLTAVFIIVFLIFKLY